MRKTSHSVRCDNPDCTKFVDVEQGQTPEGWYNVRQADEALRLPNAQTASGTFDLCSLKCLGHWSKARAVAVGEHGTGRTFAKEACPFCEGDQKPEYAPQGMRRHIADEHGEDALALWREDRAKQGEGAGAAA